MGRCFFKGVALAPDSVENLSGLSRNCGLSLRYAANPPTVITAKIRNSRRITMGCILNYS